jgi:hypothetical protein
VITVAMQKQVGQNDDAQILVDIRCSGAGYRRDLPLAHTAPSF